MAPRRTESLFEEMMRRFDVPIKKGEEWPSEEFIRFTMKMFGYNRALAIQRIEYWENN